MSSELANNLNRCELAEAANVVALLRNGAQLEVESESKAAPAALLEVYEQRAEHLEQFTSYHAKRLLRATREFCAALKRCDDAEPIQYARVDDTLIGSYLVWATAANATPVGCLYVIGKSEVPQGDWHSLWNE